MLRFTDAPAHHRGFAVVWWSLFLTLLVGISSVATSPLIHPNGAAPSGSVEVTSLPQVSPSSVPPSTPPGYLSTSYNLADGARLPPGAFGYDLSCPSALAYDPGSGDLLVAASAGVGWFNLTTDRVDRMTVLSGAGTVVAGAGPVGPPLGVGDDVQDGWVYVTHARSFLDSPCAFPVTGADYLSVINASSGAVNRTIPVGSALSGITFDATNDRLYVADASGDAVYALSGRTGAILDRIPVGNDPQNIAVDGANGNLYVTNSNDSNLSVVNASTDRVVGAIPLPNVTAPFDVVYDAADARLFVDGSGNSVVAAVDPSTGAMQYVVPVLSTPAYMVLDPLDDHVYVSSEGSASVSIVNASSSNGTVLLAKVNDGTKGAAFDPATAGVYLGGTTYPSQGTAARLHAFLARSDVYLGSVPLSAAAGAIGIVPAVNQLFAGDNLWSTLWAYNSTASRSVPIAGVNGGSFAYDATDRTLIVGSFNDGLYTNTGEVQLVKPANDTLVGSLATSGIGSSLVAWDSTNDSFWVWDWCGGTYCSSAISNYNASTGAFLRSVGLGAEYGASMIFDPVHSELYISGSISAVSGVSGAVYAVDANNGTIRWTHNVPIAQQMAYDPLDGTLYLVALGPVNFNITLLNATTGRYVATEYEPGSPNGLPITYDPSDRLVVAFDAANTSELVAYNASTNAYLGALPVPRFTFDGLAPAIGGGVVYSTGGPAIDSVRFDRNVHIASFVSVPSEAEVNGSLMFRVNASGGAGSYAYSYSGLPPGCSSTNRSAWTCHPGRTGQYVVNVSVTDARGAKANSTTTVRVFPDLTMSSLNASPTQLPANSTLTLTAPVSGGVGGYAYHWTNLPPGCSNVSSTPLFCRPSSAGRYNISLTVEDAVGDSVSSGPVSVEVYSPLAVSIAASPARLDVGQTTTLSASLQGGTGPYTVNWTGLPPGCTSVNATTLPCSPTRPGTYSVRANVTEPSEGTVPSNAVSIDVGAPLGAALSTSRAGLDVGQATTLTVTVTGGLGGYTVNWSGLPPGCPATNATTLVCAPTLPGTFSVRVNVTDSARATVTSNSVSMLVYAALVAPGVGASRASLDVGQSVTFWANATGGSGVYTYDWTSLPPGCLTLNRSSLSCTGTNAGNFSVGGSVTDSVGAAVSMRSLLLPVFGDPTLVSFTASPTTGAVGTTVSLSVTAAGGSRAYHYEWTLPSFCAVADAPRISCRLTQVGVFTAGVTVVDTNGAAVTSSTIEFQAIHGASPSPPSPFGNLGLDAALSVGAGVAIVATLLLLRRRSARRRAEEANPESGKPQTEIPGAP